MSCHVIVIWKCLPYSDLCFMCERLQWPWESCPKPCRMEQNQIYIRDHIPIRVFCFCAPGWFFSSSWPMFFIYMVTNVFAPYLTPHIFLHEIFYHFKLLNQFLNFTNIYNFTKLCYNITTMGKYASGCQYQYEYSIFS